MHQVRVAELDSYNKNVTSKVVKDSIKLNLVMEARKFIIGGNWKANGTPDMVTALVKDLNAGEVRRMLHNTHQKWDY
eukprot:6480204-Amphidinium_carterae.1